VEKADPSFINLYHPNTNIHSPLNLSLCECLLYFLLQAKTLVSLNPSFAAGKIPIQFNLNEFSSFNSIQLSPFHCFLHSIFQFIWSKVCIFDL